MDELKDIFLPFLKEHGIALALGFAGVVFVTYGLFTMLQPFPPSASDGVQPTSKASAQNIKRISPMTKKITIDVEGAVEKPGVYQLSANSRVQNALIAAGGLSQSADRKLVAQNISFAAPLRDGVKLYISAVGEQMVTSGNTSSGSTGNVPGKATKLVNINPASESELDALQCVGPVTAQKIIDNRPYHSVEDLLDKKIVEKCVFGKFKDQVSVY